MRPFTIYSGILLPTSQLDIPANWTRDVSCMPRADGQLVATILPMHTDLVYIVEGTDSMEAVVSVTGAIRLC